MRTKPNSPYVPYTGGRSWANPNEVTGVWRFQKEAQGDGGVRLVVVVSDIVDKGDAYATPSPLPRGGQFPPFTHVPVSGIGRLRSEFPFRGVVRFDLHRLSLYFDLFTPQNI
uniref:Uncharacterized protein n=1 Tax=Candidatus Kentrum sp. SD TaxID=2126332 RepID=A0A451BPJ7_9GAMM|nr:MAG: hypothetical protein BECKSD772E_GA0070983_109610 [Candidatus Kentron sp. SD]VFK80194.1 MAG: hypothetical protein BECKSD772D_GA0070982_109114 [Candidatus Kentron sp. SD]